MVLGEGAFSRERGTPVHDRQLWPGTSTLAQKRGRARNLSILGELLVLGLLILGSGFRVQCPGFRVYGSGFRVQGLGLRVEGSGCMVQG